MVIAGGVSKEFDHWMDSDELRERIVQLKALYSLGSPMSDMDQGLRRSLAQTLGREHCCTFSKLSSSKRVVILSFSFRGSQSTIFKVGLAMIAGWDKWISKINHYSEER